MSLATIMTYGDGFQRGQEDIESGRFNPSGILDSLRSCSSKYELLLQEAFCDGYNDGGQAYKEGIKL